MATGLWMIGLVLVTVLLNLLALRAAYRLGSVAMGGSALDEDSTTADADGTVACPECGVENELGYRYCRACVNELPGALAVEQSDGTPIGGLVR
ncbi:MAG: zinc ribbon domain-containing protein [Salinirussus sp.]